MKKQLFSLLVAASATMMFAVTGCKKDSNSDTTDYSTEYKTQSQDQSRMSAEDDATSDDVNSIADDAQLGGRGQSMWPCGATVTFAVAGGLKTATINYSDSVNCNGRRRSGTVVVSIPVGTHWANANAALTVNINNLKITRLSDGKSITFNGTKVITNVSGGTLYNPATTSVTHTIASSNMSITFDDGSVRTWQIAKRRTIARAALTAPLVITTEGTHSDGTNSDIAVWGTNRNGNTFSTRYVTPIVVKQCSDFRITSGQAIHTVHNKQFTVTFGLDASGAQVTACTLLPAALYMKVEWTNAQGNTNSAMIAY